MLKCFIFIISFVLTSTICFSQDKVITIDNSFDNIADNSTIDQLSSTELNKGFILQIKNESGVTKAQLRGLNNEFDDNSIGQRLNVTGFFRYANLKPKTDENDFIDVKIFKEDRSKIVKIKVIKEGNEKVNCNISIVEAKKGCPKNNFDNKFGLSTKDLDKNDVVYVYDFNPLLSNEQRLRRFYKISYERESIFGKKKFDIRKVNLTKENLKPNKQVWVQIANVNRFMYDASIEDTLVDYNSEPSALFNRMFIGDSTLLGTLMKNFSDKNFSQSTEDEEIAAMIKSISCFYDMYTVLQAEMIKAYDPCATFNCCNNVDFKTIISKLNEINSGIALLQLKYTDKKMKLESLKKEQDDCKKKEDDVRKLNERIEELKKIKEPTAEQKAELATKQGELSKIKLCPQTEIETRTTGIAKFENDLSIVNGLAQIQSQLPKAEHLRVISVFLMNMVEQNQNLSKGPIQLRGNRFDFTLHINSIDSVVKRFGYPNFKDSLHYKLPILWKPFVSFSSGSFIALGKNLQNKTYTWQPKTGNNNTIDSSKYTLVESGYTLPPMGFAALGSVEWKASRTFGFGGSVGVGLTIETNPRLAYLGGLSLFLGELRQFAVTGGFTGMQVNKLTNNFQTVANNQVIYTSKPTIEYYKELKIGGFISLTYTPFKTSRNK